MPRCCPGQSLCTDNGAQTSRVVGLGVLLGLACVAMLSHLPSSPATVTSLWASPVAKTHGSEVRLPRASHNPRAARAPLAPGALPARAPGADWTPAPPGPSPAHAPGARPPPGAARSPPRPAASWRPVASAALGLALAWAVLRRWLSGKWPAAGRPPRVMAMAAAGSPPAAADAATAPDRVAATLRGSVKPYAMHVMVADAPPACWAPKVEKEEGTYLHHVAQVCKGLPGLDAKVKVTGYDSGGAAPPPPDARDLVCFPAGLVYRGVRREQVADVLRHAAASGSGAPGTAAAVPAGITPEPAGTAIVMCVHGSRDKRCGTCGVGVHAALGRAQDAHRTDVTVYASSHIGGHAYAPTAIVYGGPCSGDWYGLLQEADAETLLLAAAGRRDRAELAKYWRGSTMWSALPPMPLPAAEKRTKTFFFSFD